MWQVFSNFLRVPTQRTREDVPSKTDWTCRPNAAITVERWNPATPGMHMKHIMETPNINWCSILFINSMYLMATNGLPGDLFNGPKWEHSHLFHLQQVVETINPLETTGPITLIIKYYKNTGWWWSYTTYSDWTIPTGARFCPSRNIN